MICIPITAKTINKALLDIKSAEKIADVIELRIDYIDKMDEKGLEKLMQGIKKPVIVTDRKNRVKLLKRAIELRADYIDIDHKNIAAIDKLNKNKTKIICSYHNFQKTPGNLVGIYQKLLKTKCDVVEIATMAKNIEDNLRILELTKRADKNIIAMCMGELGQISRILTVPYGGLLTYGSLAQGKESAPGQLEAKVLRNIYKIDRLKKGFKIYGLIGNPVNKSKGFILYNVLFDKMHLNNVYLNFLVEDLDVFMSKFRGFFKGLSVTMPFKGEIIPYLDKIDKQSAPLQAINAIVEKRGKLLGSNTDMMGSIRAVENRTDLKGKRALIIGAGGVSRAIAFGLKKKGVKLLIINRTKEKAKKLATEVNCDSGGLAELEKLNDVDILINCTSVGMSPNISATPIKKAQIRKIMKKNGLVFDSIYNPIRTRLLRDAESLGLKTVTGLELFINQAALQFELWTGKRVSVDEMRKILQSNN